MIRSGKVAVLLMLSIAAVSAVDKSGFKAGPAASYPMKQTISGVTIAAVPYDDAELAKVAFGKANPYEHGVLPVLVVMQNDTKETIRLDGVRVQYVTPDNEKIDATPARDVPFLKPPRRPNMAPSPLPFPTRKPKNPLASFDIDARAFVAKMLPPGESASGFFYFQTGHRSGSSVYLTGLQEAGSGKELFFFEIPLKAK